MNWGDYSMTLEEARDLLQHIVVVEREATDCPCCGRLAKVYQRQINHTMARNLALAYRKYGVRTPFRIAELNRRGDKDPGNLNLLIHWGLIQKEEPTLREDGGKAGWWSVTKLGRAWLRGKTTVQRYAVLYQNELVEMMGETWSVHDAMKKTFNLKDLMEE